MHNQKESNYNSLTENNLHKALGLFINYYNQTQPLLQSIADYYSQTQFSKTSCNHMPPVLSSSQHLDNCIEVPDYMPCTKGEQNMTYKINRKIIINGKKTWIRANSEQEYAEKLVNGIADNHTSDIKHSFKDYALNWFEVYAKPNIATVTAVTYQRQLSLYLIPAFEDLNIEDITVDDVQQLFNSMDTAKATKDKVRIVLNQILNAAVEDEFISRNPIKSNRLKITGKESKATSTYTLEQMKYLIQHIDDIKQPQDKVYLALQALHPLRLEELLGLQWADIDLDHMALHICRAVTHPTRNQPEIKAPKTKSSMRVIGLSAFAAKYLIPSNSTDFVIGGAKPLSFTQVRRMCNRIQKDIGFDERITPIRFRTTILTDLYNQTKDIKLTQAAAGHTTSAMTLKHYVKGRESVLDTAATVETIYTT